MATEKDEWIQKITERLVRLEAKTVSDIHEPVNAYHNQIAARDAERVSELSETVRNLERTVSQLQSKLTASQLAIEVMQSEGDTKRSEVSKISNWTRQGDIWREQVNEQLFATNKQMKEIERKTSKQDVPPQVTSYDLDQLQDKMRIITQQTVSASISAWSDKTEGSIREIERQVALVRIGGTDNSERPLSPEDVQTALQTTLPSEMLLKGAVASEVLLLESKVSDKIESKLLSLFQNEVSSTKSNIDRSIEEKVKAICS
jgi:hypothetical protein